MGKENPEPAVSKLVTRAPVPGATVRPGPDSWVARLQRQLADLQDDEAKAKETLKKCEVRLSGPPTWALQPQILLSCVSDLRS